MRLAKGSHIVVRRLFDHDRGYIFQNTDKRIVFALPFADDFTLIGTTDENFAGALDAVAPSGDEVIYLCRAVNEYLPRARSSRSRWCGRSPACARSTTTSAGRDEPEDVTRDYHLELDERYGAAPLLTVYGGKITTHRRLAEDALGRLAHFFQLHRRWTATTPLPGGDFLWDAIETQVAQTLRRLAVPRRRPRRGGSFAPMARGSTACWATAKRREDIAPFFGPLSAAEVRYLMKHEWARTADDVLWRRSKLGLKRRPPGEKDSAGASSWLQSAARLP